MKLTKLQIENFRSYANFQHEFKLENDLTVLVGPNSAGKTNLLEAIHVLSLGKSFRTNEFNDLLSWGKEYLRVTGEIQDEEDLIYCEVFYQNAPRRKKNFKRNDINLKNSEYLGTLLTVLFYPEDLNVLYLSPSLRRRYLNIILSQSDRKYLKALFNYLEILKQRNAFLKRLKGKLNFDRHTILDNLAAWDVQLIEYGTYILQKRHQLVEFFNNRINESYCLISGGNEKIEIKYHNTLHEKSYEQALQDNLEKDIYTSLTNTGPHRDDLLFFLNDHDFISTASRGEVRNLLLALKLIEIEYLKQETGKNPLLLLDDVFSELDLDRQNRLLNSLNGLQTIITTTDLKTTSSVKAEVVKIK